MGKLKPKPKHLGIVLPMSVHLTRTRDVPSAILVGLGERWEELISIMANDSLGLNEQYILQVSDELLESQPKLRAIARPVIKFVSKHYGRKYRVRYLNSQEYGPVVVVEHPGPGA